VKRISSASFPCFLGSLLKPGGELLKKGEKKKKKRHRCDKFPHPCGEVYAAATAEVATLEIQRRKEGGGKRKKGGSRATIQ